MQVQGVRTTSTSINQPLADSKSVSKLDKLANSRRCRDGENASVGVVNSKAAAQMAPVAKNVNKQNVIRGSAPTPAVAVGSKQHTFAAVARRAYLYIGNVNPNTDKDVIESYIRDKCPDSCPVLDDLPGRDNSISKAYKLTIDFIMLETLNKANFWPDGIVVKRFFRARMRK